MMEQYSIIKEEWAFNKDGTAVRKRYIDGAFYDAKNYDKPPFYISPKTTSLTKTSTSIPQDVAEGLFDHDGIGGTEP